TAPRAAPGGARVAHRRHAARTETGKIRSRCARPHRAKLISGRKSMPLDTETSPSRKIRSGLDHPVVDGDGHLVEYMPAYLDFLKEVAGPAVAERFAKQRKEGSWYAMTPEEREEKRVWRTSWWALPAKNTLDRATAMLPDLFRARMDELGLDFSVVYTTMGIRLPIHPDQELRIAS